MSESIHAPPVKQPNLMLGLILTANENALTRQSWRNDVTGEWHGCTERGYLQFLIDEGYPACRVERIAAGPSTTKGESRLPTMRPPVTRQMRTLLS
jgi:hypothetical protein